MTGRSLLTRSDSYKFSHHRQYPPGTTRIYSYFESRLKGEPICFFGLQAILKKHLVGAVVDREKIDYAERRVNEHLCQPVFNRAGWEHVLDHHGGRLPVRIRAVPEGTVVPSNNVLMTVENTDPAVPWLTNFLETILMQTWYPTTVASLGYRFRRMLGGWGERTLAPPGWLDFALHDFGFRGVSSVESAGIGGMGHLVFFDGTDTFEAVEDANDLYDEPMAGYSVPAAEHSTITSWGREHEVDAYRNMLEQFPAGIVAVVSDSYDIAEACRMWGTVLKGEVLGRAGTLVVRPDSGVPWESVLGVLEILWSEFGGRVNDLGYRVLDARVRVIQGDGVNLESADRVLSTLVAAGFAAENVGFGMGGALLQKLNRDTYDFAFKCSHAVVDGVSRDVYKDPAGMHAKASKRGRLKLTPDFATVPEDAPGGDVLRDVFLDGELVVDDTFAAIRARARGAVG